MSRQRSPRYPAIGIAEAIDAARRIYKADGKYQIDREVAVRHLGYSSLNGASATVLASLKQFGLLRDAGKGMVQLTDLALDIIEPMSADQKATALRAAAFSPALFSELQDRFSDNTPSSETLRAHLVRENFTRPAIQAVSKAYLATCEYVANTKESERNSDAADLDAVSDSEPELKRSQEPLTMQFSTDTSPPAARPTAANVWSETIRLGDSSAKIELPDAMSEDEYEDFLTWMDFVKARVERRHKRIVEKKVDGNE